MRSNILILLAVSAIICTVLMALIGFVSGLWIGDIFSQFRLIHIAVLFVCLLTLLALRRKVLSAICFGSLVLLSFPILCLWIPREATTPSSGPSITVLNFNTEYQHNDSFSAFEQLLQEKNPDILALVEVNQKWVDALKSFSSYKFNKVIIKGAGLALFSKFPIEECEIRYFGKSHHPRLLATVLINDKHVHLEIVHPPTPSGPSRLTERNQEFAIIRDELKPQTNPKILIGDLNCGPWSPAFPLILGDLQDSEQGFALQPSWPARRGRVITGIPIPPLIPIDHIFTSSDCRILERQVGPAIGSDHLPVFVRVQLP